MIGLARNPQKRERVHVIGIAAAAVALALALVGITASSASIAKARVGGAPLNGRYLVTSNGDWAKTNEVYHDETTARQVWTITSSCVDSTSCTGQVSSSEGWSADISYDGSWWVVDRIGPTESRARWHGGTR
jgi:hypothetical protein